MLVISDNLWNEIKKIIPGRKSKVGRPLKKLAMSAEALAKAGVPYRTIL